jgi:type VI secretion system protein ImpF
VPEPRQPKPIRGARTPLFERLLTTSRSDPAAPSPARVHNRTELKESVRREIARLLNTRCAARQDRNGSVIDYGIPDFSWMSAASGDDRQLLADTIARKVRAFEPRLQDVRVTIESDVTDRRAVIGFIEATLVVESIREPVSFPLAMRDKNGPVVISPEPYPGYGY